MQREPLLAETLRGQVRGAWGSGRGRGSRAGGAKGTAGASTVGVCQGSVTEWKLCEKGLAPCSTWHRPGLLRVVFLWVIGEKFASRVCPEPKVEAGRGPA